MSPLFFHRFCLNREAWRLVCDEIRVAHQYLKDLNRKWHCSLCRDRGPGHLEAYILLSKLLGKTFIRKSNNAMWNWIFIHLASIALFGTLLVDIGNGDSVEFHLGEMAPRLAISPSSPTTLDVVSFTTPLNRVIYSNACFAGSVGISRDHLNNVIHISHQGIPPNRACILVFDPVVGAAGSFGPLDAGNWVLRDSHNNALSFQVSIPPGDCNGDGIIDAKDFECACIAGDLQAILAATGLLEGDFNGDGSVAFDDFLRLSANFGDQVSSYIDGDVDCSGTVDFDDFSALAINFGKGVDCSVAAVPEPSAIALMLVGLLVVFRGVPNENLVRGRAWQHGEALT